MSKWKYIRVCSRKHWNTGYVGFGEERWERDSSGDILRRMVYLQVFTYREGKVTLANSDYYNWIKMWHICACVKKMGNENGTLQITWYSKINLGNLYFILVVMKEEFLEDFKSFGWDDLMYIYKNHTGDCVMDVDWRERSRKAALSFVHKENETQRTDIIYLSHTLLKGEHGIDNPDKQNIFNMVVFTW